MNIRHTLIRLTAASAALVTAISIAACTPSPQAASDPDNSPVVTADQEQRIRKNILDTINEADSARDTNALSARMSGPALSVRESQLKIAQANNKLDSSATIPDSLSQSVVSTSKSWPRNLFAITTVTDQQQSQRLLVLNQDNATSNYKIWGLVRLFSGVQMPRFNVSTIGSAQGNATTSGLKVTPAQAVEQYADVLENGSSSKYAKDYADDAFRQQLITLTQSVQSAITQNEGTQTQKYTADTKNIKVLHTADGGVLAVAQITSVWTRTAGNNRKSLPASESEVALFGNAETTSTLEVTYINEVALYIPASGSDTQIRAVGAERQPISVVAR
ncbi:hypothetical protein EJ419_05350 [Alloscardovia theropitheci]|uniref:DUF8094 domain-containing protein n=1 Tax=Alloscardovia theropitheci TaxID=2496842 RepID=A0A4R0QPE0_9BIFI|nr:hypothetical protein [Alloscardovia theropitheci]TCD54083.1 hypothetical protein EJ419_05350 [Alloscardovia theropitheci]